MNPLLPLKRCEVDSEDADVGLVGAEAVVREEIAGDQPHDVRWRQAQFFRGVADGEHLKAVAEWWGWSWLSCPLGLSVERSGCARLTEWRARLPWFHARRKAGVAAGGAMLPGAQKRPTEFRGSAGREGVTESTGLHAQIERVVDCRAVLFGLVIRSLVIHRRLMRRLIVAGLLLLIFGCRSL
ncbi:MAG: hypothetical protein R3C19_27120 [Planctomycetaceae bacterium]